LASDESRVSPGGSGTRTAPADRISDDALVDLSGLTLRELRDLRDPDEQTCLDRALSRVLAPTQTEAYHSFSSKI
jgi:hypothetical protein